MSITFTDLSSLNTVTAQVIAVNKTTKVVSCAPFSVPGGGIVAANSRITVSYKKAVTLTVPTAHRAMFEALAFSDPLNVLVD
jgi:hypothetical protein